MLNTQFATSILCKFLSVKIVSICLKMFSPDFTPGYIPKALDLALGPSVAGTSGVN